LDRELIFVGALELEVVELGRIDETLCTTKKGLENRWSIRKIRSLSFVILMIFGTLKVPSSFLYMDFAESESARCQAEIVYLR